MQRDPERDLDYERRYTRDNDPYGWNDEGRWGDERYQDRDTRRGSWEPSNPGMRSGSLRWRVAGPSDDRPAERWFGRGTDYERDSWRGVVSAYDDDRGMSRDTWRGNAEWERSGMSGRDYGRLGSMGGEYPGDVAWGGAGRWDRGMGRAPSYDRAERYMRTGRPGRDDWGDWSERRDERRFDQGRYEPGRYDEERGFFGAGRTGIDEWAIPGPFTGRGPRGYQRSNERIRVEVCEALSRHGQLDASDIDISVDNGDVTLSGMVDDRRSKRLAEDAIENISGVREIHNQLRVRGMWGPAATQSRMTSSDLRGTTATLGTTSAGTGIDMETRDSVQAEMEVIGPDGTLIGTIKEVRYGDFLVDRSMQRDVYVPFTAVQSVAGKQVSISVGADAVDAQGWPNPPIMSTAEDIQEGVTR